MLLNFLLSPVKFIVARRTDQVGIPEVHGIKNDQHIRQSLQRGASAKTFCSNLLWSDNNDVIPDFPMHAVALDTCPGDMKPLNLLTYMEDEIRLV